MLPLRLRDTLQKLSLEYVALERKKKLLEDRKMMLAFLGWGGVLVFVSKVLFRNPEIPQMLANLGAMAACVCGVLYYDNRRADESTFARQMEIEDRLRAMGLRINREGHLSDGKDTYDPMYSASYRP
jgi:hypothetical protein